MSITIKQGDCLEVLATLPENSIDACVTDPPYGLGTVKDVAGLMTEWLNDRDGHEHVGGAGFMGRDWDRSVPSPRMWCELYRVLKPGAYALVFAGSRTSDLMGLSLRLAGFELVDSIFYCFGAGFPKGADVSKSIDRAQGMEREVVGEYVAPDGRQKRHVRGIGYGGTKENAGFIPITTPATPDAQLWDGYRSQLKPAHEPILICRKPLEGTIAQNALKWGTAGAFNIEATRVGTDWETDPGKRLNGKIERAPKTKHILGRFAANPGSVTWKPTPSGRYPANLILQHAHDCDESGCGCSCPVKLMGEQSGVSVGKSGMTKHGSGTNTKYGRFNRTDRSLVSDGHTDTGTAARYFTQINPDPFIYSGKATKKDRNFGLDNKYQVIIDLVQLNQKGQWVQEEKLVRLLVGMDALLPKVIAASGVLSKSVTEWNTLLFGKASTDLSHLSTMYTTRTETNSTIESKILNCCLSWLTKDFMVDVKSEMEFGGNPAEIVGHGTPSVIITNEKMESALGVNPAASPTPLKISVSVKPFVNFHETVKPRELIKHLIKLIMPPSPDAVVIDPFGGSGTTGVAAKELGRNAILIEREAEYVELINARIEATNEPKDSNTVQLSLDVI